MSIRPFALAAPSRSVRLADGEHEVLFTARRLMAIEDRYGSWAALDDAWAAKPTRVTAAVLWEGTGQKGTEADAVDWLDGVVVNTVKEQLIALLRQCIGVAEATDAPNPTTPESPTPGTSS